MISLEKRVEAAKIAVMRERDVRNIVRDRILFFGGVQHFAGRHIQELGGRINEAGNQPRAGDTVDLRTLARDPARCGVGGFADDFAARLLPAFFNAVGEVACGNSGVAQFLRDALADFMSVHAIHDHRARVRQLFCPAIDVGRIAPQRARDHFGRCVKGGSLAYVDDQRRVLAGPLGLQSSGFDCCVHGFSLRK